MTTIAATKGNMGETKWLELLAKVFGGISTATVAAAGFLRWYLPRRKQKREERSVLDGIDALHELYSVMENVVNDEQICDRAILFAGHNDGGYPSPSSPYYVSALHWVTKRKDNSRRIENYRRLTVDATYCQMIAELRMKGHVVIDVATMPEGLLKDIYEAESIAHSVVVLIGVQNKKLLYVSFAKLNTGNGFHVGDVTRLKLAANAIANVVIEGRK